MAMSLGLGLGLSFVNYTVSGAVAAASLKFNVASNSQYVVVLAF